MSVAAPAVARAARPVPSLTPAATSRLWRAEVALARTAVHAPLAGSCRPARVIVYAQTDWLRVATELAANSSSCAQYYVSVPPLAADKTQPRSGQAAQIRALGPSFHALDEINYTGWSSWVAAGSGSWFDAGVTARQRMTAAGFDVAEGDDWLLNELSSAVRAGTGVARQNALAFMNGLANDGVKGVVATAGVSQSTPALTQYKVNLQDWLEDGAFWTEAAGYVSDWAQENYGDVRDYAVSGSLPADRAAAMVQYLGHETALAAATPSVVGAPAQALLASTYVPFGNAAWAWSDSYGWTAVPVETMEDFVSGQVYADRSLGAASGEPVDRIGFAWAPSNTLGLATSDFNDETKAVLDRIAAAVHDTDTGDAPSGAEACVPDWCTTTLAGAAFTSGWQQFSSWSPQLPAITSAPLSAATGAAAGPAVVQLETLGLPDDAAWARTVTLTSSAATGEFATGLGGPWSPSLALPIPVGSSTAAFYYLDPQPGMPTITATLDDGTTTSQQETIGAPQPSPPAPAPSPPLTTTQPASPTDTTPVPTASPPPPRKPAAALVPHVASVRTRRVDGHEVVSVRVRAGTKAAARTRVLIRVRRGPTTIALATRTTDANGVATWRSLHMLRPGRYTATAAVRR